MVEWTRSESKYFGNIHRRFISLFGCLLFGRIKNSSLKSKESKAVVSKTYPSKSEQWQNYQGVSLDIIGDKKFLASVQLDKERLLGHYELAADAAHVYDEIHVKFKGGSGLNFQTSEQYYSARNQEMKETGLGLNVVGTAESLATKISKVYTKIIKAISS
jgi:hypothetical protein